MSKTKATIQFSDVLFQKMAGSWYAFVEREQEMLYVQLPNELDPLSAQFELVEVIEKELPLKIETSA